MIDPNTIPSVFTGWDYIHWRKLPCPSCGGKGFLDGLMLCGICMGDGHVEYGCMGLAQVDPNHPQLGAYCKSEQMFVPLAQVTKP